MNHMSHESKITTDHEEIRKWVDERGGHPAVVESTYGKDGGGILRIDFGEEEDTLQETTWDEFFQIFEDNKLAFLYQEETADGGVSRFFKLVERE
jgi:hypothetical protein